MARKTDERSWTLMGMQAMLPGMIYMHELMAEQIAQMRAVLGQEAEDVPRITAADLGIEPEIKTETKRGSGDHKSYWEKLTPDERSAEMMRRRAVAEKKKSAKLHPRDKSHPDHAKWVAKMKKVQRKFWKGLTVAQRKERVAKLAAASVKARSTQPVVKLAVAS